MTSPTLYSKTFNIYRGDTFVKILEFSKGVTFDIVGNPLTTEPIDLTLYGDTWAAQLRPSEDSSEDIPFELDLSQLNNGIITLRLEATDTANIPTKGYWDLQVIDTTQNPNYVRTMVRGTFARIKDVTRV